MPNEHGEPTEEEEREADVYFTALRYVYDQGVLIAKLNHEGKTEESLAIQAVMLEYFQQFSRITREALVYSHNLAWAQTQKELDKCVTASSTAPAAATGPPGD